MRRAERVRVMPGRWSVESDNGGLRSGSASEWSPSLLRGHPCSAIRSRGATSPGRRFTRSIYRKFRRGAIPTVPGEIESYATGTCGQRARLVAAPIDPDERELGSRGGLHFRYAGRLVPMPSRSRIERDSSRASLERDMREEHRLRSIARFAPELPRSTPRQSADSTSGSPEPSDRAKA